MPLPCREQINVIRYWIMRYWSVSKPLVIISGVLDFALLDFHRIGYVRIRMAMAVPRQKCGGEKPTTMLVGFTLSLHVILYPSRLTFDDYFYRLKLSNVRTRYSPYRSQVTHARRSIGNSFSPKTGPSVRFKSFTQDYPLICAAGAWLFIINPVRCSGCSWTRGSIKRLQR